VTARKLASTIRYGQTITITITGIGTCTVSFNDAGQRVTYNAWFSGVWRTAATASLSSSGYTLGAKLPAKEKLTYRVYKSTDRDHLAATSANRP
jgi:predicted secreted hydrolase